MEDFIGNNIKFIAEWGQLITAGIILLSLFLLFLIGRRNRYFLPKGFFGYLGAVGLLLLILLSSLVFMRITKIKPGVMVIIDQLETIKGQPAPSLNFKLVSDNSEHSIEEFKGDVVLLNFWATWCAPCLKEMPDLNRLQEKYKDKGLTVIALSDEKRERLLKFAERKPFEALSAYTEKFKWVQLGSERPATFLINKEGVVKAYFTGSYDFDFFESEILKYLQ
ncbi:redoxin domain-containing protein [Leptobacterium flavescens]|uniref:Redoxin domain-containing protein n=1 Tax=Leptobacterium flavescens TaxID=472055 RepID=A0A6P0UQE3_9FLAO|nr:TlpA disulfide reductase family protein [Leptobacterium flavescens]NER14732.1 redoxin domain-containing protein [Leptobacterium flavescens]